MSFLLTICFIAIWITSLYAIKYSKSLNNLTQGNYKEKEQNFWMLTRLPFIILVIFDIIYAYTAKDSGLDLFDIVIPISSAFDVLGLIIAEFFICFIPFLIDIYLIFTTNDKFQKFEPETRKPHKRK